MLEINQLGSKRKEEFEAVACSRYNPCPVCYRCMSKASHLFELCAECPIPFCVHDDRTRNMVIKRENFAINVSPEVGELFKKLGDTHGEGNN